MDGLGVIGPMRIGWPDTRQKLTVRSDLRNAAPIQGWCRADRDLMGVLCGRDGAWMRPELTLVKRLALFLATDSYERAVIRADLAV
jgi:hypothetical protein